LKVLANWSVRIGGATLVLLVLVALAAPWLGTVDPTLFDAASRDLRPGEAGEVTTLEGETIRHVFLMGSDSFGRDIYSRVLYGRARSLVVGISAALMALLFGVLLGLAAGYLRSLDGPLMRVMDGIMAIPAILIAIALVALWRASLPTVISPSPSRRFPRSRASCARSRCHPRRAVRRGRRAPRHAPGRVMFSHILPNCVAPLLVQATYTCAFAILLEAILSFLGVGPAARHSDLGQHHGRGRVQSSPIPTTSSSPACSSPSPVLAVNVFGDGLRDTLDPKMAKRMSTLRIQDLT
jgi:peptide/nickel transport system permease protein